MRPASVRPPCGSDSVQHVAVPALQLKKMLVPDPLKRITIEGVLEHPWMKLKHKEPRKRTKKEMASRDHEDVGPSDEEEEDDDDEEECDPELSSVGKDKISSKDASADVEPEPAAESPVAGGEQDASEDIE